MPEPLETRPSPTRLILIAAAITLAVTLLRLAGELQHWSPAFFGPQAGGGGAVVGITWLVPLFGAWFGVRLSRAQRPRRVGASFGLLLAGLLLLPVVGFAAVNLGVDPQSPTMLVLFCVAAVATLPIGILAWPALGRTLLAYSLAARVPVAVIMLLAIYGRWGTHYDALPPGFPPRGPFETWLWIGLLPQLTVWTWFTVVVGGLFGLAAGVIAARLRGGPTS